MIRGCKCDYKKQIREEWPDDMMVEVVVKMAEEMDAFDPNGR